MRMGHVQSCAEMQAGATTRFFVFLYAAAKQRVLTRNDAPPAMFSLAQRRRQAVRVFADPRFLCVQLRSVAHRRARKPIGYAQSYAEMHTVTQGSQKLKDDHGRFADLKDVGVEGVMSSLGDCRYGLQRCR